MYIRSSSAVAMTVLLLAGGVSASSQANASDPAYTIKYSSGQPPNSPKVVGARRFGQLVEERTNGAVKFSYFDSAQLYSDRDEPLAIRRGDIQMVASALVFMDSIVPDTQIYGLPFMFGVDPRKAEVLAKSDVGKQIERRIEEKLGVKVLGTWYTGTTMYVANRPLKTIADFKDLRVRVAGSKLWEEYTRVLGASPVAIAASELFTSAQQGLIDANDSNATAIVGQKLWQVFKYGIRTNHSTIVHALMINGDFWNSLTPDIQKIMEDTAAEVTDWEWNYGIEELEKSYKTLEQNGVEIFTPSPKELAVFRDKILTLQEPFLASNPGIDGDLVKQAQALIER